MDNHRNNSGYDSNQAWLEENVDFQGCEEVLIACTKNGKTVLPLGEGNIKVVVGNRYWFLKLLPHTIYEFGIPGSLNNNNVLHRSPVFIDILNGVTPHVNFQVNGNQYDKGYYLTDGIYLQWAPFINSIPIPVEEKHKLFVKRQESYRKDVECAFGVLHARFCNTL